jgi:hypothetical protein
VCDAKPSPRSARDRCDVCPAELAIEPAFQAAVSCVTVSFGMVLGADDGSRIM